ncbi:YhcN/YlaJ family sporulation lipoprotein [Thalassobacillus hwangdonensis]|uniref:YhcN/YlaJ family sporulation lipoprotein n=1 Tax=Thalassobacillus hwangdonensis TaxID=546108 RepID=A0ABW3L3B2_9BACI
MNKTFATSILLSAGLLMTACNAGNDDDNALNNGNGDGNLNGNAMDSYNGPDTTENNDQLGYVRYTKDQVDPEGNYETQVDREAMSDMITKMILSYEQFEDAATLVSDDEVLVAYQKPDEMDRDQAADMVKKTAASLVPRYFEIYVSDQASAFDDIQSLNNTSTTDRNYDQVIEEIIKRMRQAPQGEPLYNDETESMDDPRDVKDRGMDRDK